MSCLHRAVRVVILLWQVDLLLCSPICCSVQEAIEELSVVLKGPAVAGKPLDCCVLYFWCYIGLGRLTGIIEKDDAFVVRLGSAKERHCFFYGSSFCFVVGRMPAGWYRVFYFCPSSHSMSTPPPP